MAQAREKGGRVIFIGNIPYGVSEEQICEIFGRVGQVVGFRLVYDKETHRPKGFGFLEYTNIDDAASAVRNLNDFDIMGRKIKVDYSNDNGGGLAPKSEAMTSLYRATVGNNTSDQMSALPRLPEGAEIPTGLTAPDAISKTLQSIPPPQLLDILSQMKNLVSTNPSQATALLATAPQLSYAIFQALLLLGLVDPSVLGSLIQQTVTSPQVASATGQAHLPPIPPATTVAYTSNAATAFPPSQGLAYSMDPNQTLTSNTRHQPVVAALPVADPAQHALIAQVLSMTREQIFALDEAPRGQILALRAQLGAPPL